MAKRVVFNEYRDKKIEEESIELVFNDDGGELVITLPPFTFFPEEWQNELSSGDIEKQADVLSQGKAKELLERFNCTPTMFLQMAFDSYGFDIEALGKLADLTVSSNSSENMENS